MGNKRKRRSTIIKDNQIHEYYKELYDNAGEYGPYLVKSYFLEKIEAKFGFDQRTISYVLNHTKHTKLDDDI